VPLHPQGVNVTQRLTGDAMNDICVSVSLSLAAAFFSAGVVHICGPQLMLRTYPGREYSNSSRRFTGLLRISAATLLLVPETRVWGLTLAAIIAISAVVPQLMGGRYLWAAPGMATLIAVPVAMASASISQ
jgi:hypothetical protein